MSTTNLDHESDEECVDAEAFLGSDADEPEIVDEGKVFTEKRTCPVCGRDWEYTFDMVGLWNPREEEYEWEA